MMNQNNRILVKKHDKTCSASKSHLCQTSLITRPQLLDRLKHQFSSLLPETLLLKRNLYYMWIRSSSFA